LKGEERENVGNLETHLGEGSDATYIDPGIDINSLSLSRKKKPLAFSLKKWGSWAWQWRLFQSLSGQPLTNYYKLCGLSKAIAFSLISTNFEAPMHVLYYSKNTSRVNHRFIQLFSQPYSRFSPYFLWLCKQLLVSPSMFFSNWCSFII